MTRQGLLGASLMLCVIASAVGVVLVKQQSRTLFVQLQRLERARDDLNVEWGKLQLEQGAWATHNRIEKLATAKLGLELPAADSIVLVTP